MERLIKAGKVKAKMSKDVEKSIIGLGFEKLDRDVFNPEKSYKFVANSGVKWARLQSGWQRTEREKGVYDFSWLDSIVDNLIAVGTEPWLCLCYGNDLYTQRAKTVFGAVGCPPIYTEEEKLAWKNYVTAAVKHYKGRIRFYEVWNEPDGEWCWKHGPNPTELGVFIGETARAVKAADSDAKVIGLATCMDNESFLEGVAKTGCLEELYAISYHAYHVEEKGYENTYRIYKEFRDRHKPELKIIQGESGTQSRSDGCGALRGGAWTPLKQAKYLLRHLLCDIANDVMLTSYFSCMDMIEALNGEVGNVASYLDYGYFGVIGADFDENGKSTGEYSPKMSYTALQNLCSIFCNDYETNADLPLESDISYALRIYGDDFDFDKTKHIYFKKPNGSAAAAYWIPKNILTETTDTTVSVKFKKGSMNEDIHLVDLLDGNIYSLPSDMTECDGDYIILKHIPASDSPLLLTFGDFCG